MHIDSKTNIAISCSLTLCGYPFLMSLLLSNFFLNLCYFQLKLQDLAHFGLTLCPLMCILSCWEVVEGGYNISRMTSYLLFFQLKYSHFTMLCCFQVQNEMTQFYIYSFISYYKILGVVPCAVHYRVDCLFYMCVYTLIPSS